MHSSAPTSVAASLPPSSAPAEGDESAPAEGDEEEDPPQATAAVANSKAIEAGMRRMVASLSEVEIVARPEAIARPTNLTWIGRRNPIQTPALCRSEPVNDIQAMMTLRRHRHTFDHASVLATVGEMTGVWVDSPRARQATPLYVLDEQRQ